MIKLFVVLFFALGAVSSLSKREVKNNLTESSNSQMYAITLALQTIDENTEISVERMTDEYPDSAECYARVAKGALDKLNVTLRTDIDQIFAQTENLQDELDSLGEDDQLAVQAVADKARVLTDDKNTRLLINVAVLAFTNELTSGFQSKCHCDEVGWC